MTKILKAAISIALTGVLLSQMCISGISAENTVKTDSEFEKAGNFLKAIKIMTAKELEKADTKKISRADFASMVMRMMGLEKLPEDSASENPDKYTGFGKEEAVQDEWYWVDEKEGENQDLMQKATPYRDVTSDHKQWNAIRMVSSLGIMAGDDNRYFLPDKDITGNEAVKAMLCVLGYKFYTDGGNAAEYVARASELKLLKDMKASNYYDGLTMRDISILFYNALHTEVYQVSQFTNGYNTYKKSGSMLMTKYLEIDKVKGIVVKNEYTSLDNLSTSGKNTLVVGDSEYYNFIYSPKDLLGKNITAYYMPYYNTGNQIVYIENKDSDNEILVIEAKDIRSFKNHTLSYYAEGKGKSIRIDAETDIIYNDKALLRYTDAELEPDDGSITLIDNDNDSAYDVVKVEKQHILVVDAVEKDRKIIYDKSNVSNKLDLEDADYVIRNMGGNEIPLKDISQWNVLTVKKTLEAQGKLLAEITVSKSAISGEISEINEDEDLQLTIEDNSYYVVKSLHQEFRVGDYGKFYLTSNNKIAAYQMASEADIKYGYVIDATKKKGLEQSYKLKLYGTDGEFVTLTSKDKVSVNDSRIASEAAFKLLSNAEGNVVNQLIRYRVDSEGLLDKIYTTDKTNNFVKSYSGAEKGKYRKDPKALIGARPIVKMNDKSVLMYVPNGDKKKTENYGVEAFKHDTEYTVNEAYTSNPLRTTSDVVIIYVDTLTKTVKDTTPALLVDKVTQFYKDGEKQYKIYGLLNGVETSYVCSNSGLYDEVSKWNRGDLVRCDMSASGYMLAIEKVYDYARRQMVNGTNTRMSGTNLMSEFYILHGMAYSRPYEQGYINVAPYIYQNSVVTPNVSGSQSSLYTYLAEKFVVQIYDSKKGRGPYVGSYLDIIDEASTGNGDEMLVFTVWSDARNITIYR